MFGAILFLFDSYRLHYAFDQYAVQLSALVKDATVRTKITDAIEIHKRALGLVCLIVIDKCGAYFPQRD